MLLLSKVCNFLVVNKTDLAIAVIGGTVTAALLYVAARSWFRIKVSLSFLKEGDRIKIVLKNRSRTALTNVKIKLCGFEGHSFLGSSVNVPFLAYAGESEVVMDYSIDQWNGFWSQKELKDGYLHWKICSAEATKNGKLKKRSYSELLTK